MKLSANIAPFDALDAALSLRRRIELGLQLRRPAPSLERRLEEPAVVLHAELAGSRFRRARRFRVHRALALTEISAQTAEFRNSKRAAAAPGACFSCRSAHVGGAGTGKP